jgi:hypothetical protein
MSKKHIRLTSREIEAILRVLDEGEETESERNGCDPEGALAAAFFDGMEKLRAMLCQERGEIPRANCEVPVGPNAARNARR